jgi:glycosyltransferase involved in cell wall biosynthesis
MPSFSVTLCISTYNRPEALRLCLQSVFSQTVLPAEVIIGDDGSGAETRVLIASMSAAAIPIIHVWQPDDGFRLAAIRNQSFSRAKGEYIIQIDGDLILHNRFIEDHLRWAKPGTFLCGTRSLLSPDYTQQSIYQKQFNKPGLFARGLTKKHNAVHAFPLTLINYWLQRSRLNYKYVLGANMSFWKNDLLKVNGYDESFSGWGKEDNELAARLINAGTAIRFVKFAAIVWHLYHKEASKNNKAKNEMMLKKTIDNKLTFAHIGLNRYIK